MLACAQGDAPAPKDEEVKIVDAPGATVYVKVSTCVCTMRTKQHLRLVHLACVKQPISF